MIYWVCTSKSAPCVKPRLQEKFMFLPRRGPVGLRAHLTSSRLPLSLLDQVRLIEIYHVKFDTHLILSKRLQIDHSQPLK